MPPSLRRAVLLNGSVGSGKTSTASALGTALAAAGVPGAVVDLDHLASGWPAPPGDPFRLAVTWENLAAVAAVYARHGMTSLVLAGVVETKTQRDHLTEALGLRPTLIRLTAPVAVLQERVSARSATDAERDWHVARAPELAATLDRAALDDHVVSTDGRPREAVVEEILALLGWVPDRS
ncbi:AAA family ATPase [Pseudactinotalea suaedae]|uniref:AAA family ATPase n=1 Tax=Pseudactinotalea suaedae TaxID=1524924 RepID=UPI0012E1A8A3|nr:AAA family ATPase [Pseudactinotalea suaedae]